LLFVVSIASNARAMVHREDGKAAATGGRELVPCGFATHRDAHSCGMRHRA
jgi:hypothetical protein